MQGSNALASSLLRVRRLPSPLEVEETLKLSAAGPNDNYHDAYSDDPYVDSPYDDYHDNEPDDD